MNTLIFDQNIFLEALSRKLIESLARSLQNRQTQLAVAQVSNSRRGFREKSIMFFSLKHREIESLRAISFLNALARFRFPRNLHLLSRNFDRLARKKLLLFRESPISLVRLVRFASKYSHKGKFEIPYKIISNFVSN